MSRTINPTKTNSSEITVPEKKQVSFNHSGLQDMQREMTSFFLLLQEDNNTFKAEEAFKALNKYIGTYERILYSTVSLIVYDITNQDNDSKEKNERDRYGTLLSNIDSLLEYSDSHTIIESLKKASSSDEEKKNIEDTRKAVWKIWDHVNLAKRQFDDLKQSDDEFKRRFNEQIRESQESMTKEMNSQLLTMVGIFTALAFILFGGISSLQSVLGGLKEAHLLKLLILGCVWGIGMLNVIFVFLFCIGKMTKLNFKSTLSPNATFWQRYPVVCWTDFLLCVLVSLLSWLYYCTNRNGVSWIDDLIGRRPMLVSIIGFAIIVGVSICGFKRLYNATKAIIGDEDE